MLSHSLTMELHREKDVRTQLLSIRVQRDQLVMFPWSLNCAENSTLGRPMKPAILNKEFRIQKQSRIFYYQKQTVKIGGFDVASVKTCRSSA